MQFAALVFEPGDAALSARLPNLGIRIVDPSTGELLRHLTLDPTRDYQPTGAPKGPKPKTKQTEP